MSPLPPSSSAIAVVGVAGAGLLVRCRRRPPPPGARRHFVEVAAEAGIDHTYDGDFDFFVGGGVAAFDCDDDGLQDLYLAGGAEPAALYRNRSAVGGPLRFEQVVERGDVAERRSPAPTRSTSTATASTDLAVLRLGENVVLRGLGDCRFERANEQLGIDGGDDWTDGVQRDLGGRRRACRRSRSATTSRSTPTGEPTTTAPTTCSSGRTPTATAYDARDPA